MQKILLLILALCFIFSGCEKKTGPPVKQCLHLNIRSDPATLDPRKGGDIASSTLHFLLFDGLARLDDNDSITNSLAEKIDISEDRTIYTFTLRECFWSDGTPITAWDFEKSWKDILHPDFPAPNAHLLYPIQGAENAKKGIGTLTEVGIKSLDAKTLEVTLERPTPYFLDLVGFCSFYPVNAEIDHSHPDWDQQLSKHFVCSGPFILKEWKRNNTLILAKNPYYYRADEVQLEEIHFSMVNNEITALSMFEKGKLDIIGQPLLPLPTDAIPELMKKEILNTHPVSATTFCTFNINHFPFHNVHIRRAFGLAMNRRDIVRNITQLRETPALNIIPNSLRKTPAIPLLQDADIETARALFDKGLKQLGISREEFPPVKFLYWTGELHHKIAQALQQQWAETLGVRVELESVEKNILMHLVKSDQYQLALRFWIAQYDDPMNIFERFKYKENVKNFPNWENETYISLLNQSDHAKDEKERNALLNQAEKILIEEMPLAPIFHWNSAYIAQPYVKSYGPSCIGDGFFDRVYLDLEAKENLE